ncbi:zinc ABC transporter substrate-binding protein [Desulforhopalus vacuolatus]|uniref:metal ABC transporter solute-binding protein, Zn/Mn family n=1 Tax=Desulforhopalus vacuolatus TaxID=40414 RepID=UPI001962EE2D|nr:zinc ABC transporter substrate-binding protein [Desulforhopalus vacuolatus]MBM9519153.1 zinc ABC transporter substrate-binding protein [Desulforhopalus vacuolatus]
MKKFFLLPLLFSLFFTAMPALAAKPVLFVSIVPQRYFLQQLVGDSADIRVMVLPGASPATYEPKPSQMAALARAKAWFTIGVPFEDSWLPRMKSSNPNLQCIPTDKGIVRQPVQSLRHTEEADGAVGKQSCCGLDPHIWLSPPLVKKQVVTSATALRLLFPQQAENISRNEAAFTARIDVLNEELHQLFDARPGLTFMVFHPSWGYFAREYGLHQEAVELEGKDPKPARLAALITRAKKEGIRTLFIQPQFSKKAANLIAKEIGGVVRVADPLAEDWEENLRSVAADIAGEKK